MRETIHRVACDICGRSQSGNDYTGWKEFILDDFGCSMIRNSPVLDMCPDCYARLGRAILAIREEAGKDPSPAAPVQDDRTTEAVNPSPTEEVDADD